MNGKAKIAQVTQLSNNLDNIFFLVAIFFWFTFEKTNKSVSSFKWMKKKKIANNKKEIKKKLLDNCASCVVFT